MNDPIKAIEGLVEQYSLIEWDTSNGEWATGDPEMVKRLLDQLAALIPDLKAEIEAAKELIATYGTMLGMEQGFDVDARIEWVRRNEEKGKNGKS